jgi:hypothetical protein
MFQSRAVSIYGSPPTPTSGLLFSSTEEDQAEEGTKGKGEKLGSRLESIDGLKLYVRISFHICLITNLFCQLVFEQTPTSTFALPVPTNRVAYPRHALYLPPPPQ